MVTFLTTCYKCNPCFMHNCCGKGGGILKRWSKLQKRLYDLMDPKAQFQIHMALYEMNSNDGYHGAKLPRYFITIGDEIVFDYPKDFDTSLKYGFNSYPWDTDVSEISSLIEAYTECPKEKLSEPFETDRWGLTAILRVCDRRIGKRRLKEIMESTGDEKIIKIASKRLGVT